jgi:hypothetical protein
MDEKKKGTTLSSLEMLWDMLRRVPPFEVSEGDLGFSPGGYTLHLKSHHEFIKIHSIWPQGLK